MRQAATPAITQAQPRPASTIGAPRSGQASARHQAGVGASGLQRSAASDEVPSEVHDTLRQSGQPLDAATLAFFTERLGHDFSGVRVHADADAAASAVAVRSMAYTVGQHVVFGAGQYAPHSNTGRRLLAHELAHTVQQRGAAASALAETPLRIGAVGTAHELQADRAAAGIDGKLHRAASLAPAGGLILQRKIPDAPPPEPPTTPEGIAERLETIIRKGGPVPQETRVVGAAIVETEGPGYDGPKEMRAISGAATDQLGPTKPGDVYHASSAKSRELSATRSIAGSKGEFPFSHVNDAEVKMFEDIVHRMPRQMKGRVHFMTMRVRMQGGVPVFEPYAACSGCIRATFETAGSLPKMSIQSYTPPRAAAGALDLGLSLGGNKPAPAGLGGAKPQLPPLAEGISGAKPRGMSGGIRGIGGAGRLGRMGGMALAGAANIALGIAMLAAELIIELIIMPKINAWMIKLETERRQRIENKVRERIETTISSKIARGVKRCSMKRLREMQAAGKKTYVNVDLMVSFEDTSDRLQIFNETPPESFFDIEFNDVRLVWATLSENPVEPKAGALKRCDSCGTMGRSRTFVTNNPLWEQMLSFSFEAPDAEALSKEFESIKEEECDMNCFIATACYGSPLAPEVAALRRFRDAHLLQNLAGRYLVRAYYRVSPPIAAWLVRHPHARAMVRDGLVAPLVQVVQRRGWDAWPVDTTVH